MKALINSKAKINIILKKVAIKLGLVITEKYKIYIINMNKNVSRTKGFCENIKISIKKVKTI